MIDERATPLTDAAELAAEDATTYCLQGWKLARRLERERAAAVEALRELIDAADSRNLTILEALKLVAKARLQSLHEYKFLKGAQHKQSAAPVLASAGRAAYLMDAVDRWDSEQLAIIPATPSTEGHAAGPAVPSPWSECPLSDCQQFKRCGHTDACYLARRALSAEVAETVWKLKEFPRFISTDGIHWLKRGDIEPACLEAAALLERLDLRINGYQGSRDWAIDTLAKALKIEPDTVRAVEYYAQQASDELERLSRENAELREELRIVQANEPAPCGHPQYLCHSEDGGKNIRCYACQVATADAAGFERGMRAAKKVVSKRIEVGEEDGYIESDTNAFIWTNKEAEWVSICCEEIAYEIDALLPAAQEPGTKP